MIESPPPLTMLLSRHTRRREFLALLASAAAEWSLDATAQQAAVPVVGVLRPSPQSNEVFAEPLRRYMKALDWEEGRNIRFLFVWAEGHNERIPALAEELVAKKVDVIVAFGDPAIKALEAVTTTIPVVAMTDDMIASGLASNLRRMRIANMTGISILATELDVKRLELLHEFVPRARRIGVLVDASVPPKMTQIADAAHLLGLELVVGQVHGRDEVSRALDDLVSQKVEAVNVLASPLLYGSRDIIIPRMRGERLPAIYQWPEMAAEGGFLAYGPRLLLAYRNAVGLIDKILRGARPADLPIEQPDKFELVLNLKAAEELGLSFHASLLLRADELIE
jgi:putative tryptophan/tyrosine transport system substrate-binding protein